MEEGAEEPRRGGTQEVYAGPRRSRKMGESTAANFWFSKGRRGRIEGGAWTQ